MDTTAAPPTETLGEMAVPLYLIAFPIPLKSATLSDAQAQQVAEWQGQEYTCSPLLPKCPASGSTTFGQISTTRINCLCQWNLFCCIKAKSHEAMYRRLQQNLSVCTCAEGFLVPYHLKAKGWTTLICLLASLKLTEWKPRRG